jgi:hypothetical protein
MPTTVEVLHYYFNETHVFCGFSIQGRVRRRYTTTNILKVDCIKCLRLLKAQDLGHISRRKDTPLFRRLHIKRRIIGDSGPFDKPPKKFLSMCNMEIPMENLKETQLKTCRNCKRCMPKGGLK